MALLDFKPITRTIVIQGASEVSMTVRGLNLTDLAQLTDAYAAEMRELHDLYETAMGMVKGEAEGDALTSLVKLLTSFITKAPVLVGAAIALAADEPGARDVAMTLPPAKQVEIMTNISDLTFGEGVGLKKAVGDLMAMWQGREVAPQNTTL